MNRAGALIVIGTILWLTVIPPIAGGTISTGEQDACKRLVVLLYDISGSFERWLPRALSHGKHLIGRLGPGDCLLVRVIAAESFSPSGIVTARVPLSPRPIDPAFQTRVAHLKAKWAEDLQRIVRLPKAPRTDIWGGLHLASLVFQATPANERILILYSNLDDNVQLRPRTARLLLREVAVMVFSIPREASPDRFLARLLAWSRTFHEAGARAVRFHDTDFLPLEVDR